MTVVGKVVGKDLKVDEVSETLMAEQKASYEDALLVAVTVFATAVESVSSQGNKKVVHSGI